MEQFIPLLIGLAYFIFKTYTNFKEEQEKARKRNTSRPQGDAYPSSPDVLPDARPWDSPVYGEKQNSPAQPFLLEEIPEADHSFEPRYKHVYTDRTKAELKEKIAKELKEGRLVVKEGYNPEIASEEVETGRKIHSKHLHKPVELSTDEDQTRFEFDIKDAVIKQAILNRPEY